MAATAASTPRGTSWALAALFWFTPLWASLAALDPRRPDLPLIVPLPLVVAFIATALVAFAAAAVAAMRARQPAAVSVAFIAGGLASILAGACGFDPVTGIGFGIGVTGLGLGGLAISAADARTVHLCVRALLWSSLAASVIALAMLVLRRPVALYEYDNGRAVGTFLNPNELAAYTIVALGAALPIAAYARDRLAVVTSIVLVLTLAATFSRWGFVSALCALAAYAFAARSRALLAATLTVAVVAFGFNAAFGSRHHNPVDLEMRGPAWSVGLATFERFPLLGVGPLAYARTYGALRTPDAPGPDHPIAFDPHSVPLSLAASGGIVGLITLFASAIFLQRRVYRQAARAGGISKYVALGLASGLIGLYVDCLPNTIVLFFPLGYQSVALALAVARTETA
jgi:O-antigen ligase